MIVAIANKLARIAWAVMAKSEPYKPEPGPFLPQGAASLALCASGCSRATALRACLKEGKVLTRSQGEMR